MKIPETGFLAGIPAPLRRYLPVLEWGAGYNRDTFGNDAVAAVIVTIMLIPQSLAYALLAGLPPEMGLYASILPLLAYAMFATSRVLAVGPVAIISLMTATAVGQVALSGTAEYAMAAIVLAFMSGLILLAMGVFRLGFLANFLSHPVIAGFMAAAIILIAGSQLKHLFGIRASGSNLLSLGRSLFENAGQASGVTILVSLGASGFLIWSRKGLKPLLKRTGLAVRPVEILSKTGPLVVVLVTTLLTWLFGLDKMGVAIVGTLPQGVPPLTLPSFDPEVWSSLAVSAVLISIIGFVESVSVAQTLAARKRQRIVPDQELVGLGMSNIASAISGGYPVTGGFSRSVVNFDSGAKTPAAGAFTALGILLAAIFLTPLLYFLPKATLSSIIIVAVLSLLDLSMLRKTWSYSKPDFFAVLVTILFTLGFGVKVGVSAGVVLSLGLYLYGASRPHVAEVGRVPGSEHFRNILRHAVETTPGVVTLRVDANLFFGNARFLEDYILDRVSGDGGLRHVVLLCSAVNEIDMSALESLEEISERLEGFGVMLHLSEVKGPVMDRLERSDFVAHLTGEVFLSQHEAIEKLSGA
jgi:SulP family sulfate permease